MEAPSAPEAGPGRVLIAGCGYVGSALATLLGAEGRTVWGLRRDPRGLPEGVRPIAADVTDPAAPIDLPMGLDAIVYAVAPGGGGEEAYRRAYDDGLARVLAAAGRHGPFRGRLVLVSSTGVYGRSDGGWVDEDTPPDPADGTARALLAAEARALACAGTPTVLRLGGIYGPGRDRTVRRIRSGEAECPEAGRFSNRIHRDDAAGAIRHLLLLPNPAPLYLGVDRDPADLRGVYAWVAARLGVEDPCAGPRAMSPTPSAGRRGANKRCSSARLERSGYAFRYPTFREGYLGLIAAAAPDAGGPGSEGAAE